MKPPNIARGPVPPASPHRRKVARHRCPSLFTWAHVAPRVRGAGCALNGGRGLTGVQPHELGSVLRVRVGTAAERAGTQPALLMRMAGRCTSSCAWAERQACRSSARDAPRIPSGLHSCFLSHLAWAAKTQNPDHLPGRRHAKMQAMELKVFPTAQGVRCAVTRRAPATRASRVRMYCAHHREMELRASTSES
jgi:hypothetical protein